MRKARRYMGIVLGAALAAAGAEAQSIKVTNPNSQANWLIGSTHTITWVPEGVTQSQVVLELVIRNIVVERIADSVPTTVAGQVFGRYDWTIPATALGGPLRPGNYAVRVRTQDRSVIGDSGIFPIDHPRQAPDVGSDRDPGQVDPDRIDQGRVTILDLNRIHRDKCDFWARLSVAAQKANVWKRCGFTGSEWSDDYRVHFDWCMARIFNDMTGAEARHRDLLAKTAQCYGTYDVDVTLTRVAVHDDCDNVSAGDWYIGAGASAQGPGGPDGGFEIWPNRSSASNVDTGDVVTPGTTTRIAVSGDSDLHLFVGAVDCDGSLGAWFLPVVGVPVPPIMSLIAPFNSGLANFGSVDCSGEEEIWEYSGGNDYMDYTVRSLPPADWKAGGTWELVATEEAQKGCESSGRPFTATVSVRATRRP